MDEWEKQDTRLSTQHSAPSTQHTFDLFLADAQRDFSGWDFAYITATDRMVEAPLPWSYASVLLPWLRRAASALDMGTGGGELLSRLAPFPPDMHATEGWAPNVPVARARLEPFGVTVHAFAEETDPLPFEDERFDLVINRHEAYDPAEVLRVLRPGGRFITQQVGGDSYRDLPRLLGAPEHTEFAHWTLDFAAGQLRAAGFTLRDAREASAPTRYFDIGAIVYYLRAIPWEIPDFSVARYRDALYALHERITADGYVDIESQRILIVATKPLNKRSACNPCPMIGNADPSRGSTRRRLRATIE